MFTTRCAGFLLLLALAAIPASTPARASIDTGSPNSAPTFSDQEWAAILREIKVFANAKISVRDAIEIAETRSHGARAVDVSFDGQADRLAYRVKTWRNDELWQGTIDASTGKIFGEEVVTSVSTLDAKDKDELAGFRTAGVNLYDVLSIAERFGKGKAVSAGLEEDEGRLIFLVVLVTADGSLKQMSVTPGSEGNAP
ncbi:PepSY domain-containing protein [Bradyrhizobium commune]|uniref:PepSY domain-containing protein n=1 Tax=Bradyrhizobium commune TaxID=83627 RepID=A0A7S9CZY7_9BRAD|nr:PepSY domain-containing protein [Bradyrhizobium commune]QPF88656.1 PepSY domain-containing protein [Bradyrhizobium commune]